MISTRRAALLGLSVPLTAIMVAVLGLWPEEDDVPEPSEPLFGGGGKLLREPLQPEPRREEYADDSFELAMMLICSGALELCH